jgi:hypothetical protein
MAADPDEEALSWGTERDSTHIESSEVAAPVVATADEVRQTSSALLIVYGIFAGAFVLYLVGWIVAISHITAPVTDIVPLFMYRLGEGLAIAAPALWFAGVFVLTRGGHVRSRILWLLLGLVIVAPWPFVLGGVR